MEWNSGMENGMEQQRLATVSCIEATLTTVKEGCY